MNRKLVGSATTLLLAGGLIMSGSLPASAHTPEVIADCEAIYISAQYYETKPGTDAVLEKQLVSEAVPYQPAVYGEPPVITPAVEYQAAVYEVEYEFRHKLLVWKTKWSTDPNWNAEENDHSLGWYATGNTRDGALISPEVPAQDAVYGPAPLITPEVPAQDAVYEWVEVTPAGPADETPNTVNLIVNGEDKGTVEFGTSYDGIFTFDNKYIANEYTVTITAWNDPQGYKGWTKTFTGTTTPCDAPAGPTPGTEPRTLEPVIDCEAGTITTVTQRRDQADPVWDAQQQTWIEGAWGDWYDVEVIVENNTAEECPVPTEEPKPIPPAEEPKPVAVSTPAPVEAEVLAATGLEGNPWPITIAALAVALGIGSITFAVIARRRQNN